ncbi:MAG TPA: hypothetical protein PLZ93_23935 [Nocardioides sp.]|nr:hypothetical protein [Nocardioides sp.]
MRRAATKKAEGTSEWSRRRLLGILAAAVAVAVLLLGGLAYAVYLTIAGISDEASANTGVATGETERSIERCACVDEHVGARRVDVVGWLGGPFKKCVVVPDAVDEFGVGSQRCSKPFGVAGEQGMERWLDSLVGHGGHRVQCRAQRPRAERLLGAGRAGQSMEPRSDVTVG